MARLNEDPANSPERAEAVEQVFQLVGALQDAVINAEKYGVLICISHKMSYDNCKRLHTVDAQVTTEPAYRIPGQY